MEHPEFMKLTSVVKLGDYVRSNLDSNVIGEVTEGRIYHIDTSGFIWRAAGDNGKCTNKVICPNSVMASSFPAAFFQIVCPVELQDMDGKMMNTIIANRQAAKLLHDLAQGI
jgi:hypothetical protein